MAAGIAGHKPEIHQWAEENLNLDFHMCSYYNPTPREKHKEHKSELEEIFDPQDRLKMVRQIQKLSKPVIHYKVFAAGRNHPRDAFQFLGQNLRPIDGVCFGVYDKNFPNLLQENIQLFQEYCAKNYSVT